MEEIIAELLITASLNKKGCAIYLILAAVLVAGWFAFEYYKVK